jgi:hypothetical protein
MPGASSGRAARSTCVTASAFRSGLLELTPEQKRQKVTGMPQGNEQFTVVDARSHDRTPEAQTQTQQPFVVPPGEESLFPPAPTAATTRRVSKRLWRALAAGGVGLMLVASALVVYVATRGPDTAAFEEGYAETSQVIVAIDNAMDDLNEPADLPAFRSAIAVQAPELERLEVESIAVEQADRRSALVALVRAAQPYVADLETASRIPVSQNPQGTGVTLEAQSEELEGALAAAQALSNDALTAPSVSAAPLIRTLTDRYEAYRVYEQRTAQVQALNRRRAARLASVQSFTGSFDGILARYSASRDELGNWTQKVATEGATYTEAYQVLEQQAERRRQLRDEFAALHAPAEFASANARILAVMDTAITATEDASRGIAEYQADAYYTYSSYDQTPGWRSFQETSLEIADTYASALSTYERTKQTIVTRLSKRDPLPKAPA